MAALREKNLSVSSRSLTVTLHDTQRRPGAFNQKTAKIRKFKGFWNHIDVK